MDLLELRRYLLAKPGAAETFPFDPVTLVVKVAGKMFALVGLDDEPLEVNLKCEPFKAELLREQYAAIRPGYHMNKRHWNTVTLDGSLDDAFVQVLIDESYALVVAGLTRAQRAALGGAGA